MGHLDSWVVWGTQGSIRTSSKSHLGRVAQPPRVAEERTTVWEGRGGAYGLLLSHLLPRSTDLSWVSSCWYSGQHRPFPPREGGWEAGEGSPFP